MIGPHGVMILIIDADSWMEPAVSLHPDRAAAEAALLDYVRDSWPEVSRGETAPSDEDALVKRCFEHANERWSMSGDDWDLVWSDGADRHERGQPC